MDAYIEEPVEENERVDRACAVELGYDVVDVCSPGLDDIFLEEGNSSDEGGRGNGAWTVFTYVDNHRINVYASAVYTLAENIIRTNTWI